MNNINNFSFPRLWQLIKHETKIERKRILSLLRTITCIMAIPFIYYIIKGYNYAQYTHSCIDMIEPMQFAAITVLMCQIFNIMQEKKRAILYHMLPANRLEKFLSQLLLHTVGVALLICTSYLIIECIHYPLVSVLGKSEEFRQSIAPIFFHFLYDSPRDFGATEFIFTILYGVTIYSIFINLRCRGYDWLIGYLLTLIVFIASFYPYIFIIEKFFITTIIIDGTTTETMHNTAILPFLICSGILTGVMVPLWRNSYKKFRGITIA